MIRAVIFDLDGVLFDSEPVHREAWMSVLKETGRPFTEEDLLPWTGLPCMDMSKELASQINYEKPWEELYHKKEERYKRLITEKNPLFPGLRDALEKLKQRYRLGYATSTIGETVRLLFDIAELNAIFEDGVVFEEVGHTKPHPETYQKAVSKLGLPADACVAVEDSIAGVESAKKAGLYTLGVCTTFSREELARADRAFESTIDACRWLLGLLENSASCIAGRL
jgi:HAD superfamily hydrolase (TIGR01509 family)